MGMVEGDAGYTTVTRVTHCFPLHLKSPASSSYGIVTGAFNLPNRTDRGVKDTPWDAVRMGSVVCTIWLSIFL